MTAASSTVDLMGVKPTKFLVVILLWIFSTHSQLGHADTQQAKLKAAFILSFAKFIQWPEPKNRQHFVICLVGVERYRAIYTDKIDNKPLKDSVAKTKVMTFDEPVDECNVLYMGDLLASQRSLIHRRIGDQPILSVGEDSQFINEGGIIRFFARNNRLKFEINPNQAKAQRLRISSRLLSLAQIAKANTE